MKLIYLTDVGAIMVQIQTVRVHGSRIDNEGVPWVLHILSGYLSGRCSYTSSWWNAKRQKNEPWEICTCTWDCCFQVLQVYFSILQQSTVVLLYLHVWTTNTRPRQVRGLARETDRIEITLVISCDNAWWKKWRVFLSWMY